ncbi:hypothetical protein G6O69_11415 [Pseudenhygromyxa sp. WMMC2535]|uniref:hypothetical protein n=1 Tax=Pseudenhygromyxa sp. WMMC2535 TaxID=2712867 RepID=UPI0015536796|nr:hypothetical protein [Pseudenhygromyxa sp. WMMC2535]NVB38441.1 hypothetical protein [Pseudenhygromyxa sp. WMMC2535]
MTTIEEARARNRGGMITAGVVGLLSLAIFVFWLGWVRAPSPQELCAHKVQLVLDTASPEQSEGADALIMRLEISCVESVKRKIQLRGKLVYADYAKCVMTAQTLMDAERC